ncbi:hypothetical protein O988_00230 [Pseudogymnoascus sp. VKM F-3808]|nr:hypothetical protein O988_00230 [Pseudogymnoascus sp. VKM F-3808]
MSSSLKVHGPEPVPEVHGPEPVPEIKTGERSKRAANSNAMLRASKGLVAGALSKLQHRATFLTRCIATATSSPADALEPVINPPSGIRLRQYQEECIQSVLSYLDRGHKRMGVSLATGSGKTVIFTQLIDRVKPLPCGADQTLILAHRQELVEQAAKHCINAYPTKSVDVEMGNIHASGAADITIASVQSIISKDRIQKFNPKRFKLILVDEAHHIVAPGYLKTLAYFGLSKAKEDGPALVGVSATLSRFDGLRLGAAIDQIVYHKDYIDMIGEKWLSDVIFTTVESKADISKVKKGATGDFQTGELSRAVNTDQSNEITVRTWLAKAQERKSTLVFCVDLAHIAGLTKAFRDRGVDARFVTGDTPKTERSATLDAFRAGEFPVLVNCGVFTEGTDVPNIDCVLLARPTKSRNLLVQMIGRGMRLFPGKDNCHIIDMVASLETGIISTPTLFGLDPSELVAEATVDDMKEIKEARVNQAAIDPEFQTSAPGTSHPIKVTFTDYDSVFDLIEDSSGERHIRAISRYAWVEVSDRKYILTTPSGKYLKIEYNTEEKDAEPAFVVSEIVPYTGPLKKQPYKPPREVARHSGFEDAVHAADTFASLRYPKPFIVKTQRWREKPATEGQLMFLNRFRLQNDPLTPDSINKGKAGDMITKVKHGARGRFAKVEATKRKLGRQALKLEQEEALRKRENVSGVTLRNIHQRADPKGSIFVADITSKMSHQAFPHASLITEGLLEERLDTGQISKASASLPTEGLPQEHLDITKISEPPASLIKEGLLEEQPNARQIPEAPTNTGSSHPDVQHRSSVNVHSEPSPSPTKPIEIPRPAADSRHDAGPRPLRTTNKRQLKKLVLTVRPIPKSRHDSVIEQRRQEIEQRRPDIAQLTAAHFPDLRSDDSLNSQSDGWSTDATVGTGFETLDWLDLAKQSLGKDAGTSKGKKESSLSRPDDKVVVHRGFVGFVVQSAAVGATRTAFPPLSNESYDLTTYGLDPKAQKIHRKKYVVDENKGPVASRDLTGADSEPHTFDGNLSGSSSVNSKDAVTVGVVSTGAVIYSLLSNDVVTNDAASSDCLEFCTKCQKRHIQQGMLQDLDDRDTCGSKLPDWFPKERYKRPWEAFASMMNQYVKACKMLDGTEENPETKIPWDKEYHEPSEEWEEAGRFGGWWKCRIEDEDGESSESNEESEDGEEGKSSVPDVEKNCQLCHKRKAEKDRSPSEKVESPSEIKQSIEDWINKRMKQEMVKDRAFVKARMETEGY